jgi:hypothetical protein
MLIPCPHCELGAEVDVGDPANLEVKNAAVLYVHCLHIKETIASGNAPPPGLLAACPILSRAVQSASRRNLSPAKQRSSVC